MRILHFVPDIGISNGIMSAVLNFAKALSGDIFIDVVYFHETQENRKDDIESLGGRVYKIEKPSPSPSYLRSLKALFSQHRGEWSALHINAPHFAVFIAPYAKKYGIEKICVHCHSSEFSLKGNSKRNELLSLYSKYYVRDKFACSEEAGKFWYGNRPFTVINNAIDCKKYTFSQAVRERVRNELSLGSALAVCHIGRTDIPQKNHPFILKAFAALCSMNEPSVLLLIGAVETDELKELCQSLGIDGKVRFLGFRKDVSDLLQAGDVFLFPSTSEGLPVSLIEAQAAGLPVVMSDSITEEAVLCENVIRLSLDDDLEKWAHELIDNSGKTRSNNYELMCDSGWDISAVASQLSEYYKKV